MIQIANKANKHYSPLRYPGGKSCLSDFLIRLIEANDLKGCTYAEPYAGGAGAALTLLMLEKVDKIIINDYDRAIYAFWKSVLYNNKEFIRKIEKTDISVNQWKKQKEIYKSDTKDEFKLGFATFFLNRTNRSGIIEGGPIGGVKQSGNWTINARFNKENLISRIEKISLYKNRIQLTNLDGVKLIQQLKRRKKVLTYLDPPYYLKGSSLYLNHYKSEDHKRLASILNKNTQFNWLLTYDNVSEISQLYKERKLYNFSLNYSAESHVKGQELLILSDNLRMPNM